VSTFYCLDPATFLPPLRAMMDTWKDPIPAGITLTFPAVGDILHADTGVVYSSWSATPPANVVGVGAGAYAGRVGACINWLTATVVGRRRLRGRTFVVPIIGGNFEADGTISNTVLSNFRTNAATFVTAAAGNLEVWHRPVGGTGGLSSSVVASTVNDRPQVLTSRLT
jgi:hypothetical protein